MTLKSRFFFVTVTTTFAVALAVIFANQFTHHMHESRYLETAIDNKRALWNNIVSNELDIMNGEIFALTRDADLRVGLLSRNPALIHAAIEPTFNRLAALQIITKLQIVDRAGLVLASAPENFMGATKKAMVSTVVAENRPVRGIERDDDGELLAILAVPLYAKSGKPLGVAILARNLVGVLQRFMERDASLAFIADRGDIIGLPVESNILPDISGKMPPLGRNFHSVERLHGRAYQVTILSVKDYRGEPISHMVAYKDATDVYRDERAANITTYAIIIAMLVASVIWLYWFVVIESARLHELERRNYQQLSMANQRLQDAVRVKSDFLANMSHELRTPLNSVIGFSGALLKGIDGPLNPEQRSSVQYVYNSGQHLLALINDVLDISKIEAGKMVLNLETVDLATVIQDSVNSVMVLFKNKNLPLRMEIAEGLPQIYGDDTRIKQVLLNVLSNAAKFTDKGEVVLHCRLVAANDPALATLAPRVGEEQTHWVLLSVSDTGIGIRPEDQDKVFEEFRQLETGSARKYGGTGLGMTITRRIVELHGGHIWLRSKPGVGSTFFVVLPVADQQARGQPGAQRSDPAGASPASGTRGKVAVNN